MAMPHDPPTAEQLIESVREWLETDVFPNVEGRLQFHTRVAMNVLSMVERELSLGEGQEVEHRLGLASFGCETDEELAKKIRDGVLRDQYDEVEAFVFRSVEEKLRVANPKYLRADQA